MTPKNIPQDDTKIHTSKSSEPISLRPFLMNFAIFKEAFLKPKT
jgi:hypothetical protein